MSPCHCSLNYLGKPVVVVILQMRKVGPRGVNDSTEVKAPSASGRSEGQHHVPECWRGRQRPGLLATMSLHAFISSVIIAVRVILTTLEVPEEMRRMSGTHQVLGKPRRV